MTRICDRLNIRRKFISGLLENADAMLTAQGEELGSWHSSQFRSHVSRDTAALKHLESRHELNYLWAALCICAAVSFVFRDS
jgi:hypothetical protein